MTTEFSSRFEATQAAKEQSIKHPGIGWYVNWIEDNFWGVSIYADYTDQEYYMNGQLMEPEHFAQYD